VLRQFEFLRCSVCKGRLRFKPHLLSHSQGELICNECGVRYEVKDYAPDMLPPKIRQISLGIDKFNHSPHKFPLNQEDYVSSGKWISNHLGIDERSIKWGGLGFRHQLAFMLKQCSEIGLSLEEMKLVIGILASRNMSGKYKSYVADQLSASEEASGYEAYEDIMLRKEVDESIEKGDTAIIEIGSGVGRLLHQYGTCISRILSPHGSKYRRLARLLYDYRSDYEERLKLIFGIDFEWKMIRKASMWLRKSGLENLLKNQKIVQARGLATELYVDLDARLNKVVTILFSTLGNQLGESLQIKMLEKAKELASPNGIVFVSVFNRDAFDEQAESYYRSIEASVGKIAYCKNGVFLSDRGVFSVWFYDDRLRDLFKKAGMNNAEVLSGKDLQPYEEYKNYIGTEEQKEFKKRAIIATATVRNGH